MSWKSRVYSVLTGLFDEGVVVADHNAVPRSEDVELDDVHAEPDRLDEGRHRVALDMSVRYHEKKLWRERLAKLKLEKL